MANQAAMIFYVPLGMLGAWAFYQLFRLGREIAGRVRPPQADDPMARLQRADALAAERRNEEALAEYLWCFDHGSERHPAFGGLRLSFLLASLARLGRTHPPARQALQQRRDRLELAIDGQTARIEEALDYAALNHCLDEDGRTMELYNRLAPEGKSARPLRSVLFQSVFDRLLEERRYADILGSCRPIEQQVDLEIEAFEATRAMAEGRIPIPLPPGVDPATARRILTEQEKTLVGSALRQVVETGGKYYEVLLGAARGDEAARLADRLIDFANAGDTYAVLIRHALRAARPDLSAQLARRGKETLPREQHDVLDAASAPPRLP